MMRRCPPRRATTLVELLAAMAVSSVLCGIAVAAMLSLQRTYDHERLSYRELVRHAPLVAALRQDARTATGVTVGPDVLTLRSASGQTVYRREAGAVVRDGDDRFPGDALRWVGGEILADGRPTFRLHLGTYQARDGTVVDDLPPVVVVLGTPDREADDAEQ